MKQYIKYLATAALLALFACSEMERESPVWTSYISFGTPTLELSTAARTKARLYDGSSLPDSSSFGVMAYCYSYAAPAFTSKDSQSASSSWDSKWNIIMPNAESSKNTKSGIYKQEIVFKDGICTYPSSSYETWIENGKYSFLAYYPIGKFSFEKASKGPETLKYSIPSATDYKQTEDVMASFLKDRSEADGSVKFRFRHLLTALAVEVNNLTAGNDSSMSDEEKKLIVHSITLNGSIYNNISYVFRTAEPEVVVGPETVNATYSLNTPANAMLSGETFKTDYMLLCPGISPNVDGIEVTIDYTFKNKWDSFTAHMKSSFDAKSGWKYKLSLNFVGNVFTVKVVADGDEHWEGGNSGAGDVIFM